MRAVITVPAVGTLQPRFDKVERIAFLRGRGLGDLIGTLPAAESLALAHAGAYAHVLRSLRVGGSFAYVPALPFVEALLPDRGNPVYRCERISPPEGLSTPALRALREDTGLDLAPASRVWRTA